MNDNFDNQRGHGDEGVDFKELMLTYLGRWYWYLLSIAVCAVCAWGYLRYTTPIYRVSSSIVINSGNDSSEFDMQLESLGVLTPSTGNFENELLILRSRSLIKSVITELDLYITYTFEGRVRDVELYNTAPIKVWLSTDDVEAIDGVKQLKFERGVGDAVVVTTTICGEEQRVEFDRLPAQIVTPKVCYNFDLRDGYSIEEWDSNRVIIATISPPSVVAAIYKSSLSLAPASKSTTVVNMSLTTTQRARGVDFINKLIEIYNRESAQAKSEVSRMTSEFINDRILIIDRELNSTEQQIESYKQTAGIVSVESFAGLAVNQNTTHNQRIEHCDTELRLVRFLRAYTSDQNNRYEIIPANVAIIDNSLASLIASYNELLLERKRLLRSSSPQNPAMRSIDSKIEELRSTISTTIDSVEETLLFTLNELGEESAKSSVRIYDVPTRERELIAIMRQQEIKSGLYLMLLEKREQNAMALATTTNNARIFEETIADGEPISPNCRMIYLVALIFSLALPTAIIMVVEFFKFRIETSRDVERITNVPILGVTPFIKSMPNLGNSIVVEENNNDIMAEGFRYLRTNVLYMLRPHQKMILLTSTHSAEGKSYVSANLAISMSLMGKKVVVVGLDLRKPGLNAILGTSSKQRGISSFLSGQTTDLMAMIEPLRPNLYVLYGGSIPPNSTELLSRESVGRAFDILRQNFDYVILDSAPVGMVTDTLQFSSYADLSIYVCRSKVTAKSDFALINDMQRGNKLPNMGCVIVGVDRSKRGYGYGYGGKYGYGGQYGYGEEERIGRGRKR